VGEYVAELTVAGRSAQTIRLRRAHLRILAKWAAPRGPFDLRHVDLVTWQAGQRWAVETRRSVRATLTGFYAWAVEVGYLEASPAVRLPRVRMASPAPHPAPEDAYRVALGRASADEALMLRLAGEMGLRRGEVARVHARDVMTTPAGYVLRVIGKGARFRALPMPDDLARLVLARGDGYAFPGEHDGHASPDWVGVQVSRLLPGEATMHSLRHSFATRAYGVAHNLLAVQQLLGHASVATTQRYVAVEPDDLRATVLAAAPTAR